MRTTHQDIYNLIALVNQSTGENYKAGFSSLYGGWDMYKTDGNNKRSRGWFGFDLRKGPGEFFEYLLGIINALQYQKYLTLNK